MIVGDGVIVAEGVGDRTTLGVKVGVVGIPVGGTNRVGKGWDSGSAWQAVAVSSIIKGNITRIMRWLLCSAKLS
ncbi:MAG: hypothetical protein Kow00117_14890 [Phototrophicales bacterium]